MASRPYCIEYSEFPRLCQKHLHGNVAPQVLAKGLKTAIVASGRVATNGDEQPIGLDNYVLTYLVVKGA